MGPTVISGLPAHPLLVHFVVVLVPLTAFLLILAVCWPYARHRIGIVAPATALLTLVMVPITTNAGEWLERRTEPDPLVEIHTELGDQLIYWSAAVFLVAAVWWVLHNDRVIKWREDRGIATAPTLAKGITIVVAVLAVALSVGSVVQVYRIGESGARAVWHDQAQTVYPSNDR
ncbi:DUF2231 domain-containing protein [Smaragdicoccus niigatensis]|uniref:DUF2231 domain-containing protein n=1 Tax=Smaragdicoccus niigatensis TaxID=359359 RepID=UPI0003A27FDB|nr:DUF2231 domain-containing protein [Smaragdicoccus niigatensis]